MARVQKVLAYAAVASCLCFITLLTTSALAQTAAVTGGDGQPLYDAIRKLRMQYGWVVNYQEPPWEHPSDIENPYAAPRHGPPVFLTLRHRNITIEYAPPKDRSTDERRQTIDAVVSKFSEAGAGDFRVYHDEVYSYVVPQTLKRVGGEVENITSICDATVSMPEARRSIFESVNEILAQVSRQIKVPIALAMVPPNLFLNGDYLTAAKGDHACRLLSDVLEAPNFKRAAVGLPPGHVSWSMLYDDHGKMYYFNVGPVNDPAAVLPEPRAIRPNERNRKK